MIISSLMMEYAEQLFSAELEDTMVIDILKYRSFSLGEGGGG
jgi:hypothetical protein